MALHCFVTGRRKHKARLLWLLLLLHVIGITVAAAIIITAVVISTVII